MLFQYFNFAMLTLISIVSMTDGVLLRCSNVPTYLHNSDFYESLDKDDDEEYSIPSMHFKSNALVNNDFDVVHILSTLRFWGSMSFPEPVISYLMLDTNELSNDVVEEYVDCFPIIKAIHDVRNREPCLMINTAIKHNCLELVQYLHKRGSLFDDKSSLLAGSVGSIPILKYIHEHGSISSGDATSAAALMGHLHCLQYLHSIHCPWHRYIDLLAAENGHAECLKYVVENGHELRNINKLCKLVARKGHAECLQYLLTLNVTDLMADQLVHWAADSGNAQCLTITFDFVQEWPMGIQHTIIHAKSLECFIYSVLKGCRYTGGDVCSMAGLGLLRHLEYVHTRMDIPFTENTMHSALYYKHFHCVQYLSECGCPWNYDACGMAIECNEYDWLIYLHEHGATFFSTDCNIAARCGNLRCLQYLHIHFACWDEETCLTAARYGHLDCLKYLHENGCPWDVSTTTEALQNNHMECYNYAKKHGCPLPSMVTRSAKWFGW